MHTHTTNTQQQLLSHCQALGNPDEPHSDPLGWKKCTGSNKVMAGKSRLTVALHTLTTRCSLLQKALYLLPLDISLLLCDSLPAFFTTLISLLRDGVTRCQRGSLNVLANPANCRGSPHPLLQGFRPYMPYACLLHIL